ncbi:MAG: hypothetical protein II749_03820 [Clostridia bacterium]|nr:hypothetical protein [Clostridia bacterium]
MKTRMFFPILLIILMIFMLQFAFFPRKGNSEELPPANAREIIEDTVSRIRSVLESGSVTAVADKLKGCTDPYEREYIIEQFLDEMNWAQDSGDISRLEYYEDSSIVSFYVDNLPLNICLEEQSDLYSGISSEGLPPSIPLTGGNTDSSSYGIPVLSGEKLKALILSWDNQPYDRKDLENIDDLGNATHWDLAQLYEYHMTHNACADIQVDRIDDFGIKDIKKDIFDDYDLIYINTHGYLKDGFPYFETSEVGGWLNLEDNGIWKKGELHLPEGVELYFDIGDPFESGHYAIGPDYMINEFPENTSLVVLRYGNEKLNFLGGANYGEWDGSDDMRSCMSIPATDRDGFILDMDGEGFNDWSIRDHSSEPLQNGVVQGYLNELLSMGIEGNFIRSIYDDGGPERTAVYSLTDASSCYTATGSELTMLGTISTYNLYDTQYLTVTDHTGLLDAYR